MLGLGLASKGGMDACICDMFLDNTSVGEFL